MAVSPSQQNHQSLATCGNHEPPPQHNILLMSVHATGDGHYQPPAPTPSSSAAVWMGYPWHMDSVPVPNSNPTVDDRHAAYPTLADSCVCGCCGDACIPQREYDRPRTDPLSQHDLQEIIRFSVNGKCGYPLSDALRKRYRGLEGRDDKMFVDSKTSISLRLEWLPYGKWTKQIRTVTWQRPPELIDRAKLATEVAKRMKYFFVEKEGELPDPSYMKYRVKPGTIDIDHLELVALKRVSKSSWMPHFRLIAPPQPT